MREAEPKDYDITDPKNYNLHKSTYCNGVGHIARGNVSGFVFSFSDFIQSQSEFKWLGSDKVFLNTNFFLTILSHETFFM